MFYLISKLFTFLLMPVGIILVLVTFLIYSKNRTRTKRLGFLIILLTYCFSSPLISNKLASVWESEQLDISALKPHSVGVLLTGGLMEDEVKFPTNLNLGNSGDRLWQTLHLYELSKINYILISGGGISWVGKKQTTEIDFAKAFLIQNGVPEKYILLEKSSRNTNENAMNSANLLTMNFPNQTVLLITSAYHMPRAMDCFKKRGIRADAFPSDFIKTKNKLDLYDLIPTASALNDTSKLFKEIIGLLLYKLMSYA